MLSYSKKNSFFLFILNKNITFVFYDFMTKKKNILIALFLRKRKKNESFFKYATGLIHLWLGLLSSIVICIICLTGCLYAFKNQITDLYNYDKVFLKTHSNSTNIDEIQKYFSEQDKELNQLVIPDDKDRSWSIYYTDKNNNSHFTYFDPYLKKELGASDDTLTPFFRTVIGLHKNLLLGDFGRQIVGVSVLIFLLLLFSGLILWFPKKLKFLKQGLTIKFNSKFERLNYDLHNVLGFYAGIFLTIIAITGLYITYPWVKNTIITSLGGESIHQIKTDSTTQKDNTFAQLMQDMLERQHEKSDPKYPSLPLSQIIHKTNQHLNYTGTLSITMPNSENPRYTIVKINSENWLNALLPDEISFNKKGELKTKDLFLEKPLHQQFISLSRPLHTGKILGLPGIILYFFASLIGFILPITGFIIWWNRVKKQI